jgi:predicted flap endonuclease-1-like 5' DNA nuclease
VYDENVQKLKELIKPTKKKPVKGEKKKEEKKPKREKKTRPKKEEPKKEVKREKKAKKKEATIPLKEVKGIGKKRAETLEAAGITSANDLISLSVEEIVAKADLSETMAKKLKKNAEDLF